MGENEGKKTQKPAEMGENEGKKPQKFPMRRKKLPKYLQISTPTAAVWAAEAY